MALTKVTGQGLETLSDGVTITVTDTSDVLSLVSTDAGAGSGPGLNLYRNSSSGASGDGAGKIAFHAEDANSDLIRLVAMFSTMTDATNGSEDGSFHISTMTAGTERDKLHIYPTATVFNEDSQVVDFRVESNGNANMLLVDGQNDRVNVGNTGGAAATFNVQGPTGDAGFIASFEGSDTARTLFVANFLCGSDNDRVGLYFENQGVANSRLWVDDTGDLRIENSNPSADNSGNVVGSQSFSATHIYKTDATDLTVGESVKLVGRKIVKTTSANDKLCVGIYAGQSCRIVDSFGQACNETDGYGHAVISLGDTRMVQSDVITTGVLVSGSVSAGDLLCTSNTAGKLTTQADDIIRSYTVGKAIEDGDASAPVYAYIYCG